MNLSSAIRTSKPLIRKCAYCKQEFVKQRMGQRVCGTACSIGLISDQREKRQRKEDQARKQELKTRADWLAEAQIEFNAYIRARDAHLPCISCGTTKAGQWDAGHYRSRGACSALRFHEDNCHKQCSVCNQHLSGNIVAYRIGLLEKIGADRLAFIEGPHDPRKFTIEEAKQIKAAYRAKLKELKGSNA